MSIAYTTAVRTSRMSAVNTAIGTGGTINFYSGSSPGPDVAVGVTNKLLATITLPSGTVTDGVLSFECGAGLTATGTADAGPAPGTAVSWARVKKSNGTTVGDITVGTDGTDVILDEAVIMTGSTITITSVTITEGNDTI